MENHTRICLFVIALKLWYRFACSCIYCPSLIFNVTYMMPLPSLPPNASVFHCDTRNLTIPVLFAMTLSSLFHDFTA